MFGMFCRLSTVLIALAFASTAISNPLELGKRACNADNCARQVTGTANQPAKTQRAADCSSFLASTVTPAPIVKTVTSTILPGQATASQNLITTAQTSSATNVPTYINMCGTGTSIVASRYSSACACFSGVSHGAVTSPTPTVTTTVYTTCSSVILQATSGPYAGNYFDLDSEAMALFSSDPSAAQRFDFRNGHFYQPGSTDILLESGKSGIHYIYLDENPADPGPNNNPFFGALDCTIANDGSVSCVTDGGTAHVFEVASSSQVAPAYPQEVNFNDQVDDGYVSFVPKAIGVCGT